MSDPYTPPASAFETPEPSSAPRPVRNPWTSIWVRPRATVRTQLASDPRRSLILIAAIYGVSHMLSILEDNAITRGASESIGFWPVVLISLALGPVLGILTLYIGSWLCRVTSGWLGGTGDGEATRCAYGWSLSVAMWQLPVWATVLALHKEMILQPIDGLPPGPMTVRLLAYFALLIVYCWHAVVTCKALGEAQGFSAWKGLGATVLAMIMVIFVAGGIGCVVGLAFL